MDNLKSSSEKIMYIFMYGLGKISKCITNIRENRKVVKSYFCLFGITIGIVFGCLVPIVLYPSLRDMFSYVGTVPYIIVYLGIIIFSTLFGANFGYLICKFLFMIYNYVFYGNTNEQYSKLSEKQIDKIIENKNVNLSRETIIKIDIEIIKILKNKGKARDKQLIKTAHERFRLGDIKLAMMTTPIFSYVVGESLENDYDRIDIYNNFTHLNSLNSSIKKTESTNKIQDIQNKLYECISDLNKFIKNRRNNNDIKYTKINLEQDIEMQSIEIQENNSIDIQQHNSQSTIIELPFNNNKIIDITQIPELDDLDDIEMDITSSNLSNTRFLSIMNDLEKNDNVINNDKLIEMRELNYTMMNDKNDDTN